MLALETTLVSTRLARAWEFLSGEQRTFDFVGSSLPNLQFAEFSYFMQMTVQNKTTTCGVGVLMQRSDAILVAAAMFGVPPEDIPEADLQDACSEVCNVFSDSMAVHIGGDADVSIELPFHVDQPLFARICEGSVQAAIYRGDGNASSLLVAVFDPLCQLP